MKKVLVAPLDWGLGHASRCVPVVKALLALNCEVVIAGSGHSLTLLQMEFPSLRSLALPAYNPVYPTTGSFFWKMIAQLPHFRKIISLEQKVVEDAARTYHFDLIISDNRYGCRSRSARSVLMTHQLNLIPPRNYSWAGPAIGAYHRKLINRFDECWVPDVEGDHGLAGKLSAGYDGMLSCPIEYIGHLSRFSPMKEAPMEYQVSCILSGPEPQRSIFEELVERQLKYSGHHYIIVRGVPASPVKMEQGRSRALLAGNELQGILARSELVVARSGYSTLMDLAAAGKKAILVPTPQQPEQEYLAHRLKSMGICYSEAQDQFEVESALVRANDFKGFSSSGLYEPRIQQAAASALNRI